MGTKNKITEENYKEVVLKRSIIICWVLLAICLVIKLFGGNFFGIVCTNEKFVKFCEYCDTSFIRYVIYFTYFMFESSILILIIKPKLKLRDKTFIMYFITCVLFWLIKVLVELEIIAISVPVFTIISLIILYLISLIYSKRPILSLLVILYQVLLGSMSSILKNISFTSEITDSLLLSFIFSIDYYIVLILTLLYIKKINIKKEI